MHVSKQKTSLFRHQPRVVVAIFLMLCCLAGCGNQWNTQSVSQSSFHGSNLQPARQSKSALLNVSVLGHSERNSQVIRVTNRLSSRVRQLPRQSRTLIAADCGILALYANDLSTAEQMLDESILTVSSISVAGKEEMAATSLHGSEAQKTFKGEPHERVMIYLYRGLLFFAGGDYENAHACFLNAALQDSLAQDNTERGDWLAIDLLLLQCKQLMGTADAQEFAARCRSRYATELMDANNVFNQTVKNPVIFIIGTGRGPVKTTQTQSGSTSLGYVPADTRIAEICVVDPKGGVDLFTADDVYVQAATRGQRSMDTVLTGKAKKKGIFEGIGTAVATAGIIAANAVPGANIVGALIQEAAIAESDKIDSTADVRRMSTVPGKLYMGICDREALSDIIVVQVFDNNRQLIGQKELKLSKDWPDPVVVAGLIPY